MLCRCGAPDLAFSPLTLLTGWGSASEGWTDVQPSSWIQGSGEPHRQAQSNRDRFVRDVLGLYACRRLFFHSDLLGFRFTGLTLLLDRIRRRLLRRLDRLLFRRTACLSHSLGMAYLGSHSWTRANDGT